MSQQFEGHIGRTYDDSTPWWPPLPHAPEGAPNIVVVLLDDVGYAQLGCYGSDIATLTFDGLGFAVGSQPATPIDPSIEGRGTLPANVLGRVVVEVERSRPVPPRAEANADLATQ